VKETALQISGSVKKERQEILQVPEQRLSPAACGEGHDETGCAPAAHGGSRWSRYLHCSLWRAPNQIMWMYHEGICDLIESPHQNRLLFYGSSYTAK